MFSRVHAAQVTGLKGSIVRVEVDRSNGLHSFTVVGLPDKAVEESRERVSAAIKNSGFKNPKASNEKIILSLSPSDLKKEGSFFDLASAIALLLSSEELKANTDGIVFVGELSLDGTLRPVRGILPITIEALREGFKTIVVPYENVHEARLVSDMAVVGAKNLAEIVNALLTNKLEASVIETSATEDITPLLDFADIRGQESAKRGLIVAAAGGHNSLMYGPPGTGKTMLAKAFAGILPALSRDAALQVTGIHSAAGRGTKSLMRHVPIRSPHHSSSYVAMIGGGAFPRPGEITLAHKGVLFLDEFPEFDKRVLENLREPLEERVVTISRAKGTETFPSHFILIAAMNPCPCGYEGSNQRRCICAPFDIIRYRKKISGPILDRIDITLSVEQLPYEKLAGEATGEKTEDIKKKIMETRAFQKERLHKLGINKETNAELSTKELERAAVLSDSVTKLLNQSAEKLALSARAYHRVVRLARTIADLESSPDIIERHILEALQYRPKLFQ